MDLNKITVTDIVDVISVFSAKDRLEKMTDRKCYGISFTAEGQITYTLDGKSYISNPDYAVILPKWQSYTIHGDKSGKFAVINFECENFFTNSIIMIPVRNIETLINNFERMKNLFLLSENRLNVMSIFYEILNDLSHTKKFESNILTPTLKYLESNYSHDITNKTLAQKCNISEVYFRKLFTKVYGLSPKQYIINLRINRAKQILTEGTTKINSISEQCGFSNPYHFCRLFKQKTGLTPSEFMKQNQIYKI